MKLLLLSTFAPLLSARVIREQPRPQITIVDESDLRRGIGIHFTTSYVTAAVRYENGEIEDLVRIDGDAEYIDLMARWANLENKSNCDATTNNRLCDLQRTARNRHTGDVGRLSMVLREVRNALEEMLDSPIANVMPVFPALIAINEEDVDEAFAHVGLNRLHAEGQEEGILQEPNAAYAGLGYGLCEADIDALICEEQQQEAPHEQVLFLNFDNSSFSASVQQMRTPYERRFSASQLDPALGWWDLPVYQNARREHWERIGSIISNIAIVSPHLPNKIILLGDHAKDREFLEVIKTALWELYEFDVSLLLEANVEVDSETLSARGAAELAFRSQTQSQKHLAEQENIEL